MFNIFLATLISIFHIFIILFVLIVPFLKIPILLMLHSVGCFCLFVHWYTNSDACCLTQYEAKLRNVPKTETIFYKFIGPLYNISELFYSNFIWALTIILFLIGVYNFWTCDQIKEIKCMIYQNNYDFTKMIKLLYF
jgi:hypothetical protein